MAYIVRSQPTSFEHSATEISATGGRRDLLKASTLGLLPVNLQRALAMETPAGAMDAIKHVVILMQENRSFDHYYGTQRGVRVFNDPPYFYETLLAATPARQETMLADLADGVATLSASERSL